MLFQLPDEVLIDEVLPRIPVPQLATLCQTNSRIRHLCNQPGIWHERIRFEFPELVGTVPDVSPMIFYFDALKWYDKTNKDFPNAPNKPAELLWSQWYRRLLIGSGHIKRLVFVDIRSNLVTKIATVTLIPGITSLRSLFSKAYNILKTSNPDKTIYGIEFETVPRSINVGNQHNFFQQLNQQAQPQRILFSNFSSNIYSSVSTDTFLQNPPWLNQNYDIVVHTMNKVDFKNLIEVVGAYGIAGASVLSVAFRNLLPLSFVPVQVYLGYQAFKHSENQDMKQIYWLWRDSHKIPEELVDEPLLRN